MIHVSSVIYLLKFLTANVVGIVIGIGELESMVSQQTSELESFHEKVSAHATWLP